jgi:hypothetical protein
MEAALSRVLQLISTLDPLVALLLFAICFLGEISLVALPYLLESAWILIGYQLGRGALPPVYFLGYWLASQTGRQAGAIGLFYLLRIGSNPLVRYYNAHNLGRFIPRALANSQMVKRLNLSTPLSTALGRLIGLRLPVTLMLAMTKKLRTLLLGVLFSSLVWDAIYITLGFTAGATAAIKPSQLFFLSIGGLSVVYLVTFLVNRLRKPPPDNMGNTAPQAPQS